jgi:Fic family protein
VNGFAHSFYIRREAVLSSQIEGTQSSLAQLLLFELEEIPGCNVGPKIKI